jgi:hypothetical protein
MMRALGVAHIVIAVLLLPLTIFPLLLAPIMMAGPVWAIVLGVRMWKRRDVRIALRRTRRRVARWSRPYSPDGRLGPRRVFSNRALVGPRADWGQVANFSPRHG